MRQRNYLRAVVIVHGKSELQIFKHIKSTLRLKMEGYANKNGESSTQITGLKNILYNRDFRTRDAFLKKFDDVLCDQKGNLVHTHFKLFIIMDTDDCTTIEKQCYISKEMFKEHWLYEYIVPIYNSPELESVLTRANIPFEKKGEKRKKEYVRIFPTKHDSKKVRQSDVELEDFCNKLRDCESNLHEFVEYCLMIAKDDLIGRR